MTTATRPLCCHRCGSTDLLLHETHHEHAEYGDGLFINEYGHIEARGEAVFTIGEIKPRLTRIECAACGHEWHPRRQFIGIRDERG